MRTLARNGLNRSCIDDEYLYFFSAHIHIRLETKNRFYKSLALS